ncbi:MAG TPA: DapH/DapD/GlmU-related protein [Polyangiales bacterium]
MNWTAPPEDKTLSERVLTAVHDEVMQLRLNLLGASVLSRLLSPRAGSKLRVELLRSLGFEIGAGTVVTGAPRIRCLVPEMPGKLVVGRNCAIDMDVILDLGERITLGDGVTLGHGVMILTTSHELGPREHRAGKHMYAPVTIGAGAWLGARAVVLPGVNVGEGAVVAEGSLVNKDVPPHTRVAGVPARGNERLDT